MTNPTDVVDPGQIVAVLTEKALSDMPRMVTVMDRLTAALDDFKTKGDGGLEGAIRSVEACLDYFEDRKPDWKAKGLLNPLLETLETLNALKSGGSSRILFCNDHKVSHQLVGSRRSEMFYRTAVCALIDDVKRRSKCSLDEACRRVARRLRSRHFPLGRDDSNDIITLINWRKKASVGHANSTTEGLQYARSKASFSKIDAPLDAIIDDALETLSGIFPPGDRKLK
jgi:hypothetical protein